MPALDLAATPEAPYYAVIFTSLRSGVEHGYEDMAERMVQLASQQPGFLGIDSARSGVGITVSYWRDLESIAAWKRNTDHLEAQRKGRSEWYSHYTVRVAKVEYAYSF